MYSVCQNNSNKLCDNSKVYIWLGRDDTVWFSIIYGEGVLTKNLMKESKWICFSRSLRKEERLFSKERLRLVWMSERGIFGLNLGMIILLSGSLCGNNYTFKLEKNHYIYVEKVLNFFRFLQMTIIKNNRQL